MKKTIFILVALISLFCVSCKRDKKDKTAKNQDTIVYPSYEDYKPVETDQTLLDSTELNNNSETAFTEDDKGNLTPQTGETKGSKYYVVVGSFKNYDNAVKLQKKFEGLGYTVEILPNTTTYNRVSVSSFTDKPSAVTDVKSLRTKHNDASFWIFYN